MKQVIWRWDSYLRSQWQVPKRYKFPELLDKSLPWNRKTQWCHPLKLVLEEPMPGILEVSTETNLSPSTSMWSILPLFQIITKCMSNSRLLTNTLTVPEELEWQRVKDLCQTPMTWEKWLMVLIKRPQLSSSLDIQSSRHSLRMRWMSSDGSIGCSSSLWQDLQSSRKMIQIVSSYRESLVCSHNLCSILEGLLSCRPLVPPLMKVSTTLVSLWERT